MRSLLAGLACAAALCAGASAMAQEPVRTAFYFVPRKGVLVLTPQVLYTLSDAFDSTFHGARTAGVSLSQASYGLQADYGVNRLLSLGAIVNYRVLETKTTLQSTGKSSTLTNEGWTDVTLYAHGLLPVRRNAALLYGLTAGLSPDRAEAATALSRGNQFSGGHGLQPIAGAQMEFLPRHFLGLKTSYLKRFDRSQEGGAAVKTLSGGDDWELGTLFYERSAPRWLLSLALSLDRIGDTRTDGALSASGYLTETAQIRGYLSLCPSLILIAGYGAQRLPPVTTGASGTSGTWLHTVGAAVRVRLLSARD